MTQRLILLLALMVLLAPTCKSQAITASPNDDSMLLATKGMLVSDLQVLDTKSVKLDNGLARAVAKAEIAAALWSLDNEQAKALLREAYKLTLPDEAQNKSRDVPIGAPPKPSGKEEVNRNIVRSRVLEIAGRDKSLASELTALGAQRLGRQEEIFMYESLASKSIADGDNQAAGGYILKAIDAEPTLINAGNLILDVAARDRTAADKLIVEYVARLRPMTLSQTNGSAGRVYFMVENLMFPGSRMMMMRKALFHADSNQRIPPAGEAAIKTGMSYLIESMSSLEQREPGSAIRFRDMLLSLWLPLKKYTPELTGQFLELEKLSRRPGEDASLPQRKNEQANKSDANYEKRVKEALDSDKPDDLTINFALGRGDFDKARKLIDKLPDGAQKTQFIEDVNTREAISLATKGDTLSAQSLAEKLNKAVSILQAYPLIINKCAAKKDNQCATVAFYQALRQLKNADTAPYTPPAGIPASVVATIKEFDPVLSSLGKLAKAVLPVNDEFAFQALDEMVQAANRSELDTSQGRTGFDADVFKQLAAKNELRAQQAALNLKDELRQIVARASIAQWKAKELADKAKAIEKRKIEASKSETNKAAANK